MKKEIEKNLTHKEFKAILFFSGHKINDFCKHLNKHRNFVWQTILKTSHINYKWIDELVSFVGIENYNLALSKYRSIINKSKQAAALPGPDKEIPSTQKIKKPRKKIPTKYQQNTNKIGEIKQAAVPGPDKELPSPQKIKKPRKNIRTIAKKELSDRTIGQSDNNNQTFG